MVDDLLCLCPCSWGESGRVARPSCTRRPKQRSLVQTPVTRTARVSWARGFGRHCEPGGTLQGMKDDGGAGVHMSSPCARGRAARGGMVDPFGPCPHPLLSKQRPCPINSRRWSPQFPHRGVRRCMCFSIGPAGCCVCCLIPGF